MHNTDIADTRIKVDVTDMHVNRIATLGRNGGTNGNGGTVIVSATEPSQATYLTTATQSWNSGVNLVFQIGGSQEQGGTAAVGGVISECIAMDRNATTEERQQVEGYLAWKWNIVSVLPADHPYKNSPPYV
jgi:hypothetical protein